MVFEVAEASITDGALDTAAAQHVLKIREHEIDLAIDVVGRREVEQSRDFLRREVVVKTQTDE